MPTLDFSSVLTGDHGRLILNGATISVLLFVVSWVLAMALASVLLAFRSSRATALQALTIAFVEYHRNVPGVVQLLLWYFGVPQLLPQPAQDWVNEHDSEILFAVIALSLNAAAYMSEDMRSGLRAVPSNQMEAARALGLNFVQSMRDVLVPQALRISRPALTNQALNLFKATSLAFAIGVGEMTYASRSLESETYRTFETFSIASVFYLAVSFTIMAVGGRGAARTGRR